MRAVRTIAQLEGIASCVAFKTMYTQLLVEGELKEQYQAVMAEEGAAVDLNASLNQSTTAFF